MKSQYQINKIKERLEKIAMSSLRDGDDYAYVATLLHNANLGHQHGIPSREIDEIVIKAADQVFA